MKWFHLNVFHRNDFQFVLGAPQASQHKTTEMPMVYLNKGQFYPITLQGVDSTAGVSCSKVKVSHTFIATIIKIQNKIHSCHM